MKRVIIAVVALGAIGIAAAAAGLLTLRSIDWSEYEEEIVAAVRDATGRELALQGGFDVHIGLVPEITLGGLRFQNADWGTRADMATLEHLTLRVGLLKLVFGEVEFRRVELAGLDLLLETNAEGYSNWLFWDEAAAVEPGPSGLEEMAEIDEALGDAARGSGLPISTLIRRVDISDARVVLLDGQTGETQTLVIDRFEARSRRTSEKLRVELEARYQDEPLLLEGDLEGVAELLAGGPLGLELDLRAGGARLSAAGAIAEPLEPRGIDLALSAQGESLAALSTLAGSELPDYGAYEIALQLRGGGDAVEAKELTLQLGDLRVEGELAAELAGERPRLTAKLASPRVDLAMFGGEDEAQAPPPASKSSGGSGRVFSGDPLPFDVLTALDAELALEIGELLAGEQRFSDVVLGLDLVAGKAVLDPVGLGWFDGRIEGDLLIDTREERPRVATALRVRQLDVGALAKQGGSGVLTGGRLDLDAELRGHGESVRALMATLDGQLQLALGRGTIRDEWAERLMADVGAMAKGQKGKAAELNCAIGDLRIRSGRARPEHLVIDTPTLALFGDGEIDLRKELLAMTFDRQASSVSASNLLPPFKLTGTLAEPEGAVDAKALGNKLVDVASLATEGGRGVAVTASHGPPRCHQVLARYDAMLEAREAHKQKTRDAARTAGREGRKVFDRVKGLFGRE